MPWGALVLTLSTALPTANADARAGRYSLDVKQGPLYVTIDGRRYPSCKHEIKPGVLEIRYGESVQVNGETWQVAKRPSGPDEEVVIDSPSVTRGDQISNYHLWFQQTSSGSVIGVIHYIQFDAKGRPVCSDSARLVGRYSPR